MASSLPEMHLVPTELQAIIKLVKSHDKIIAAKLDEAYHSASFNVIDNHGPVCFISHAITQEDAAKIQGWLARQAANGYTAEQVKYFACLVDQWRAISGEHL